MFNLNDGKHINLQTILGYNKLYNLVICARHGGKTSAIENGFMYPNWLKGYSTVIFERYKEDIFPAKIKSIETRINDLLSENDLKIELTFSNTNTGVVEVYANTVAEEVSKKTKKVKIIRSEKSLFTTIISLNTRLKNTKQITITKCKYAIFDEYLIDPQKGEKYLKNEWFSIKTICDTLRKKNPKMKFIALGNPYSKFSPFIANFNVNVRKMLPNTLLNGQEWAVWCWDLPETYKKELMAKNKEYDSLNDEYTKWALGGEYINDKYIKLKVLSRKYRLLYLLQISGKTLGVYFYSGYKYPMMIRLLTEGKDKHNKKICLCREIFESEHGCYLIDGKAKNEESKIEKVEKTWMQIIRYFKLHKMAFHDLTSYYLFIDFYDFTKE